jgi:hypothetical protein
MISRCSSRSSLSFFRFAALFVAVTSLASVASAQNPNGALRGEVQDSSGGRITAARVVARATASGTSRETNTNDRGEFRLEGLLPGAYQVTVLASGFADARSDVAVVVSSVRDLTVVLSPAAKTETVTVQGKASSITTESIDTASAVHGGAVGSKDLDTIPLAHRSFANIAFLVPGTEPVEPSDPTKARITAVSVGGSSGLNQELSVDGGDNSDDYIGGFLQNFRPMSSRNSPFARRRKMPTPAAPSAAPSSLLPSTGPTTTTAVLRSTNVPRL